MCNLALNTANETAAQTPVPESTPSSTSAGGVYTPGYDPMILQPAADGRMSGSDNMAKIHRAQWEDYRKRFAPVEDMLFSRLNDSTHANEAVDKAGLTMAKSFDAGRKQTDREMSRYGVRSTGDQAEASERTFGLKKAAATAGARNATRTAMEDQKMGIMAGGLSTVAQQRGNG